jgi:integrase
MEHAPTVARPDLIADHIDGLSPFWAGRMVSSIKGKTCRDYAASRSTQSMARHELETLRAAVRYFHREYGLDPVPAFTLPEKHGSRERWLTRQEAARLLRASRGLPHLRRFILIGLYTGTRSGAVLGLSWMPSVTSGWINLEMGILHRAGSSQRKTSKRQPPVKLPSRLIAHLTRWKAMDGNMRHVVNWNGSSVQSVKKAFKSACKTAGLGWYVEVDGEQVFKTDVCPHTLRHSAATWLMQAGVEIWDAAGFLGMTPEVLTRVYGHHSPLYQSSAAEAIGNRRA